MNELFELTIRFLTSYWNIIAIVGGIAVGVGKAIENYYVVKKLRAELVVLKSQIEVSNVNKNKSIITPTEYQISQFGSQQWRNYPETEDKNSYNDLPSFHRSVSSSSPPNFKTQSTFSKILKITMLSGAALWLMMYVLKFALLPILFVVIFAFFSWLSLTILPVSTFVPEIRRLELEKADFRSQIK